MLAGALRRSCCRQGTVGTEDCRQGRCSEELSGRCWQAGALWQRYCCQGEPSGRCCWLGHRSGRDTAGRGAAAELLAGGLRHCGREPSGRCCWPGRRGEVTGRGAAVAEILLARSTVAELLPAAAERHYSTKKKRVTPKPSWTCGSPSCLLTTCYGCLRFAII